MLRLSLLIQATERVTGPIRRIRSAIRGMVVTGERDVGRLDRMMKRLGDTASGVGRAIGSGIRWGGLALGAGATGLITSIIKTGMEFERFQVILEGTEGSAAGAKRALAWVKNFTERTPYQLSEVTEAYAALRAYGVDPASGALENLGNLASGTGKTLMEAVAMMADAQMGQFERLLEFQIKAAKSGDQVTFTYTANGKQMTKVAKNNALAIQQAISAISAERFTGLMDRQSRTLGGILSNLMDKVAGFQLDVGSAGFFDHVKGQLQALLTWVNKLASDGTLRKWAGQVSAKLIELANKLRSIDWLAIWGALKGIGSALMVIGSFFATVERVFGIFNVAIVAIVAKIAFSMYGLATALGIVSIAGAPLWLVVGVIAAIAAGALLVWKNWDTISGFFTKAWAGIKNAFVNGWNSIWAAMPGWMKGILTGAAFTLKILTNPVGAAVGAINRLTGGGQAPGWQPLRTGPPVRQGSVAGRQTAQVGGKLDISIRTDRGATASVTKMASNNNRVPLVVNRGALPMGG